MRRVLLVGFLALVALGLPDGARGLVWSSTAVDTQGSVGVYSSLAMDANGDAMVSYYDISNEDLKFAICDQSLSTYGNCAEASDWTSVTIDSAGKVGFYTSIALEAAGDPVISYRDVTNGDLKFATCDLSASANGNCDQQPDWVSVAIDSAGDVGYKTSIAVDPNGDPLISYRDVTNSDLKFAICDTSASLNGNCDQAADWSSVTVDSPGNVGFHTDIAVDTGGDPAISYWDVSNNDLKFAICDLTASLNGNCDQPLDWQTTAIDTAGSVGSYPSIAVSHGDPVVSYYDTTDKDLKFAVCDVAISANGNCDQTGDWSTTAVDSGGDVGFYTSMSVDASDDPLIAYYDATNLDLKFATCSAAASANGNCDQTDDWSTETVDSPGIVGRLPSISVDIDGSPVISYTDESNFDLKFATASATDADGDGLPDPLDNCPSSPNPGQDDSDSDGLGNVCDNCPTEPNAGQLNVDGDQWGDACDNCISTPTPWMVPPADGDCDGFADAEEAFVGTSAADPCADTQGPDDEPDDKWPADLNDDQIVNIVDIVQLTPPAFGASPPDAAYLARKDFNGDATINILDIVRITPPTFGESCT